MSFDLERKMSSLEKEELTTFIYSYAYRGIPLSKIRYLRKRTLEIPELSLNLDRYNDSKAETLTRAMKFGQSWHALAKQEKLSYEELQVITEGSFELSPFITQFTFFKQSVELQSNEKQIAEWGPKMENCEIFGCYAQTELAHGSDIRGMEIEANFDEATQEFVLHSPTVSACKYWIGALGNAANHALLIAQLKIKGNSYGPHAFLVPIRDSVTHEPLPGVDVGEIGPRIGLHTANNGYLSFQNYRIAKKYMLNRFSQINDKNEYEILNPDSIKILYISLVRARLAITMDAWWSLASALTIATRYSLVRRQFPDPENPSTEMKILDYQIQQFKLFHPLSLLYAYTFARIPVIEIYVKAEAEVSRGESASLQLAHCWICLYKVYVSNTVIAALEMCRRSCGGHGFLMNSGLPSLYTTFLPKVTYDGENTVLALQALKYLIGLFDKRPPEIFAYLYGPEILIQGSPFSPHFQQLCLEAVAQYKLRSVYKKFKELSRTHKKDKIWSDLLQIEGIGAMESIFVANVHLFYIQGANETVGKTNKEAIETLRFYYAATEIGKVEGVLLNLGVRAEILDEIKDRMIQSLKVIRKHALGLVEAYEINEKALNSVLGREDGDIYKHLFQQAKFNNPVNKVKFASSVLENLRPKI